MILILWALNKYSEKLIRKRRNDIQNVFLMICRSSKILLFKKNDIYIS